jgi:hypothetical protein
VNGNEIIQGTLTVNGTTKTTGLNILGTATATTLIVGTATATSLNVLSTATITNLTGLTSLAVAGPFGANSATPQSAAASGGAIALTPTNTSPYGFSSAADFNAMQTLINNIRSALVADGIMS